MGIGTTKKGQNDKITWVIPLMGTHDPKWGDNTWIIDHLRQLADKIESENSIIMNIGLSSQVDYKLPQLVIELFETPKVKKETQIQKALRLMDEHLNSPEGQEFDRKYFAKLKTEQERLNDRIERFHVKFGDKLDEVIERLITKYQSDAYRNKEFKKGREPNEALFWVIFDYAKKYCDRCEEEKYLNMFTTEAYYIGSYVIQQMNGQGSVIQIEKQYNGVI